MLDPLYHPDENKENIPPSPRRNLYNRPTPKPFHEGDRSLGSHWTPASREVTTAVLPSAKVSRKETPRPPSPTKEYCQFSVGDDQIRRMFLKKNIDLSQSRLLGTGHYSKVITADHYGSPIAMKVINTTKVTKEYFEKFLPREIECWKKLQHDNIVAVFGHYQALHYVFLTMEYAARGDLLSYVQKVGAVPEKRGRLWAKQLASALAYMHDLGIVHRDLKLENIVVFSSSLVKLADFGFSRHLKEKDMSATFCGSKSYSAPEVLIGRPYDPFKSDVWSLGVVIFVYLTDAMPFREDIPNLQVVEAQKKGNYKYPSRVTVSEDCRHTIDAMLTFKWKERPDIHSVLEMPWFKNLGESVM